MPETHDPAGGVLLPVTDVAAAALDPSGAPRDGVTISRGEPFFQPDGLPALHAACTLRHGRVPAGIWRSLVADARTPAADGHEAMLAVVHEPPFGYRLLRPPQVVGAKRVFSRPTAATVLEVHSHHRLPAFFSRTDDADEQGLRLYAVVGRLDAERPEVAVRVGACGYFLPLPWEDVFEGGRGGFRDMWTGGQG